VRPDAFFRAYLVSDLSSSVSRSGEMAIRCCQYITGGPGEPSGAALRIVYPPPDDDGRFFVPTAVRASRLYPWAPSELRRARARCSHKEASNLKVRSSAGAVVYFAVWTRSCTLEPLVVSRTPTTRPAAHAPTLEMRSRGGLLSVLTELSRDRRAMSLDPHWFSTIYGILIMGGKGLRLSRSPSRSFFFFFRILARRAPLYHNITPTSSTISAS